MKLKILVLFSFIVLNLIGCAPYTVQYYRPAADGGIVRSKPCIPTESLLDIIIRSTHGSINIRSWAADEKNINTIYLGFSGKGWSRINFTSTDFKVIDLDSKLTINALSVFAHMHDGFKELNTELYAVPQKNLTGTPWFSINIRLPDPMPNNFELSSPPLIIDGEKIKIPTIRFEKKVWVGVIPFNC